MLPAANHPPDPRSTGFQYFMIRMPRGNAGAAVDVAGTIELLGANAKRDFTGVTELIALLAALSGPMEKMRPDVQPGNCFAEPRPANEDDRA